MKQDYVLKKFVKATSAAEALKLDRKTEVSEVFLVNDKPDANRSTTTATGFRVEQPEEE